MSCSSRSSVFPAEVKRRIGEAVTAATQFTAQKSAAEPKQDMSSSAFLCYHTESDWRRVNTAGTTEGKVAVFVSRAARIGLTSPTDDYLRKVRGCVRVCECARDCVCVRVCVWCHARAAARRGQGLCGSLRRQQLQRR